MSALALATEERASGERIEELRLQTAAELERIGAALSLKPQSFWVDTNGLQVKGDSGNAGKDGGLNPGIVLTVQSDGAKYVVSDAPVSFSFIKGSGRLVDTVTTDEYGQANSSIIGFDDTAEEFVIRASVEYSVDGFTSGFHAHSGISPIFLRHGPRRCLRSNVPNSGMRRIL